MRAVVMAGGEGSRLRPLTASTPKPLLPIANRPVMEHVLRLVRRHGITEAVATIQFLGSLIRSYFGDGDDLGIDLEYAAEPEPLGTAGSVRYAAPLLGDEPFLVISGDALTDIDLTGLIAAHERSGALVTVALSAVPEPLDFGIVVAGEDGRIERFLEKPTWGQVFSDRVNTGIYVMQPEVLAHVAEHESVDWSGDVFPALLAAGAPIYGWTAEGYWEDVGTHQSYLRAQADVLNGEVEVEIPGRQLAPGVWAGEDCDLSHDAQVTGPVLLGNNVRVEVGAVLDPHTVLGDHVVVRSGAHIARSVVQARAFVDRRAQLHGAVIGKDTDVMAGARVEMGSVVGDDCVIGPEAHVLPEVLVYPFKRIEPGAVVQTSVIWEPRGRRTHFGPRGVSGLVNVEITPEHAVRLAQAYATLLPKGSTVTTSRDASRASRMLKRAVISGLTASGIHVRDLEVAPGPLTRYDVASGESRGGVILRTSPGDAQSVDISFLDASGRDLSPARQRAFDRAFSRQEGRRAFPWEIGDLTFPSRRLESYVQALLQAVDVTGVREAAPRVVVDAAGGAAAVVVPRLLGPLNADLITVNARLDTDETTETETSHLEAMERLGQVVRAAGAVLGVRFDPAGETLALVDEEGRLVHDDQAFLLMAELVAAEQGSGALAAPAWTSRALDEVAHGHGLTAVYTALSPAELSAAADAPGVRLAGDGRGGFVVPELTTVVDGMAAFVRLLGLVVRRGEPLSALGDGLPVGRVERRSVPTPWRVKGQVMRAVLEAAGDREVDTTDGVRVVEPDGAWCLVVPDPGDAQTFLWAEGTDRWQSVALLDEWAKVIESCS